MLFGNILISHVTISYCLRRYFEDFYVVIVNSYEKNNDVYMWNDVNLLFSQSCNFLVRGFLSYFLSDALVPVFFGDFFLEILLI